MHTSMGGSLPLFIFMLISPLQQGGRAIKDAKGNHQGGESFLTLQNKKADEDFKVLFADVVKELPHDGEPFTQGLEFTPDGKFLIETSGSYPPGTVSYVRRVDPETGQTVQKQDDGFGTTFLEGIATVNDDTWISTTYDSNIVWLLDNKMNIKSRLDYPWQGWGLSRDVKPGYFLATNGTEYLIRMALSKKGAFRTVDAKPVTCMGKKVAGVNELELVDEFPGFNSPQLVGNLMGTRVILFIDPETAQCTGAFHLNDVSEPIQAGFQPETSGFHVANGVAYSKERGTFFVTGKNWNKMFEVKLSDKPGSSSSASASDLLSSFLATAPAVPPGAVVNHALRDTASLVENEGSTRLWVSTLQIPGGVQRRMA